MANNTILNSDEEKIENLLNLSTTVSKTDLEMAPELSIGYDVEDSTWELIVRYTGDGSVLNNYAEESPVFLLGNYGIIKVKESNILQLADETGVIFIEKPKRLFPGVIEGIYESCIYRNQNNTSIDGIYGEGVLVGIVDSGIDYTHHAFRNQDGSTRILELWDQTLSGESGYYNKGRIFSKEEINRALNSENHYQIVPSRDLSGHGTHVAGIAAGNFSEDKNNNIGLATKSELIVVKMRREVGSAEYGTIQLMEGIDFIVRLALKKGKPLALNISYGSNYGSHDGGTLLETYIDYVSTLGQIGIAIGTGNEGGGISHNILFLQKKSDETKVSEIYVANYERNLNVQMWKYYEDIIEVKIDTPSGNSIEINGENQQKEIIIEQDNTKVLIFYGEPKPYSQSQEIYIELIPTDMYIARGIWKIIVKGIEIVQGRIDMYLQGVTSTGGGTGFVKSYPETTLTIPSTASKAVSVGAYDGSTGAYANFSGRGYTRDTNQIKPDIVAPGVEIVSALPGGGEGARSGTSMATPFVTGSMALLMDWGITKGNDKFLYGEKLKAVLKRNAKRDNSMDYPNEKEGYGKLCVFPKGIR